jgi:plasmid stability protein
LDEETLRRVRIHALEHGTSLNAIVRAYLERLVGDDPTKEAGARLVALAGEARASSGAKGRIWRRDELYDV